MKEILTAIVRLVLSRLVGEFNDANNRREIRNTLTQYLSGFCVDDEGNGEFRSIVIVCDETNNGPLVIDNNDIVINMTVKNKDYYQQPLSADSHYEFSYKKLFGVHEVNFATGASN